MEHEKGQVAREPKFTHQPIADVKKIGEINGSDLPMVLASVLVRFEGVERIRRIVAELPGDTDQEHYQVFYGAGTSPVAQQLCVSLD